LNPSFAEGLNDLGGALDRLGRTDEAIAAFRRAADAKYDLALYNLGIVYLRKKQDPAKAQEALEQTVRLGHASVDAWNALGVSYAQQGEYRRAREAWDQALRLDPGNQEVRRNRERLEQALAGSGVTSR
jgi:tetratricopeptide (TPR) repeat protein